MSKLRSRLTFANVVSMVALFVALGGSSYAAVTITGKQIKDSSITTDDIKDRSLLNRDFKPGQLPRGGSGPQGPAGVARATILDNTAPPPFSLKRSHS